MTRMYKFGMLHIKKEKKNRNTVEISEREKDGKTKLEETMGRRVFEWE